MNMKYIIANWKSNKNKGQVVRWLEEFESDHFSEMIKEDREIIIAPAMPSIAVVAEHLNDQSKHPRTALAVQDISPFSAGSYTGAVSVVNLEGFGVQYAILGHSERRDHFGESDQDVANKVSQCVEAGITPIVCIDEDYLISQASAIDDKFLSKCIVAYEPLSAIGTGEEMNPEKVVLVGQEIKQYFDGARFIYGGSVDPGNVSDYLEICDGVLVGGASLKVEEFKRLI